MLWFGCTLGNKNQSATSPPYNATTCTQGTGCLSYLGAHRLPSSLCAAAWHLAVNLLPSLLLDTHLMTDRYSADLYSGYIVLYNIKLLC